MQHDALLVAVHAQRERAVGAALRGLEPEQVDRELLPGREVAHFETEIAELSNGSHRGPPLRRDLKRRFRRCRSARLRATARSGRTCGRPCGVVDRVRAHRVHVAEDALDRVVEEDRPAAAGLEQAIDCVYAARDGLSRVEATADAGRHRDGRACLGELHQLAPVTAHGLRAASIACAASAMRACTNASSATRAPPVALTRVRVVCENRSSAPRAAPIAGAAIADEKTQPNGSRKSAAEFTDCPGLFRVNASTKRCVRCSGTKAPSTTMSLLPVPHRPATRQLSSIG